MVVERFRDREYNADAILIAKITRCLYICRQICIARNVHYNYRRVCIDIMNNVYSQSIRRVHYTPHRSSALVVVVTKKLDGCSNSSSQTHSILTMTLTMHIDSDAIENIGGKPLRPLTRASYRTLDSGKNLVNRNSRELGRIIMRKKNLWTWSVLSHTF